ncbi:MAG: sensor histidine kinase, partial [Planctomycetota bacterium]
LDYSVPEKALRVVGDVTLIEQAVSNVIHNAVRHNEPGGHVAVLLEEEGEGGFVLRNIDDGPGVTPEELSRMTELNFRGDRARSRSPEGLGLGLHIAKDVAERHGFELTFAESEYGGLQVEFRGALAEA